MARGWFAYAGILVCALSFYLFSPGYLSFYLLVVLLLLPILSLLLTLPARIGLSLTLDASARTLSRGEQARFSLTPKGKWGRVYGLKVTWRVENLLYPQFHSEGKVTLDGTALSLPIPTQHCGWVRCTVVKCQIRDWMGLFRLPVKVPAPALCLVCPLANASGLPDWQRPGPGAPLHPRPAGGPGEEYELRDYRPGDPVTAIHWKLTAKRPEDADPVLRETMEPIQETLVVSYDHFGAPEEVDRALDRLAALTDKLLNASRSYVLCWTDPDDGIVRYEDIRCRPDYERSLRRLSAHPAPKTGESFLPGGPIPGRDGPIRYLRISGQKEGEG